MTRLSAVVAPLLALVAALLLTALPASARGPSAPQDLPKTAIGVRVLNEAGKPVPGAVVELFRPDGKKVAMRLTNLEGRAIFVPVKPGDYIVRAGKPGVGKGHEQVTAVDGELVKTTVRLKKP